MIKKKVISVAQDKIPSLQKAHKASRSAVYNALAYRSNSAQAQLIRKNALEFYGGVVTTKAFF